MKIAIAGFQHETNTSAPAQAGVAEFRMSDSWPGVLLGDQIISGTLGMNLPIAGAIEAASGGVELVPIVWCAAEPSGCVTDEAFDWVSQLMLETLSHIDDLDGVYLDLHGAMVTDSYQDGEAELLKRIQAKLGDIPIGVSLDLHANISPAMVRYSTLMTIYRTYPHLDMADAGKRCIQQLVSVIQGHVVRSAYRQLPFLIPLHAQYTGQEPCHSLYQQLDECAAGDGEWVELAMGFTAADIHDCGVAVVAYARSQARAEYLAQCVANSVTSCKHQFDTTLTTASHAVRCAMESSELKPVVIADVQDNPGAGGTSDTTGVLQALISSNAYGAVLGVVSDAEVAEMAHRVGVGSYIDAHLGAKAGLVGHTPVRARFKVLTLSDGNIAYTGRMYGGGVATLGPSCLLSIDHDADIRVVVSSNRIQCLDQALFTHFGINLYATKIIVVKSTVHHRAEFEPLASKIINVAAPGVFLCDLDLKQYTNLRNGMECL